MGLKNTENIYLYSLLVSDIANGLNKIKEEINTFDWSLHAGGALHYYALNEIDISDIDIIFHGINLNVLKKYIIKIFKIKQCTEIMNRRFSRGVYNGTCLEFNYNGIDVHLFNPIISRIIINGQLYFTPYDNNSFKLKKRILDLELAPLEDILLYKIMLQRSNLDNKRDIETVIEILSNYDKLNYNYINQKITSLRIAHFVEEIEFKILDQRLYKYFIEKLFQLGYNIKGSKLNILKSNLNKIKHNILS